MKNPTFIITLTTILIGFGMLTAKADNPAGALFFVPFSLGPQIVSLVLLLLLPHPSSQRLLLAGALLYAGWFVLVFLDIFYWHMDPQGPIVLVFVGFYALPVLIPIWIVALVQNIRNKPRGDVEASGSGGKAGGI